MTAGPAIPLDFSPVAGVRLAAVAAGLRYRDRLDLVLMEIAPGSTAAGLFTRNAFPAAPVTVCREHLARTPPRFLLINSGSANAGTGAAGKVAALHSCHVVAAHTRVSHYQVLPFSTGVIGEPLPLKSIEQGLPKAVHRLAPDNWPAAAQAILTTDTRPKLVSRQLQVNGATVTITGMAKGAGMIKPNMATMLAFVATDAAIQPALLRRLLTRSVRRSFNSITVDGDTSTNDSCMLVATGASGVTIDGRSIGGKTFSTALEQMFRELAQELIRDAEGATRFVTIEVSGGRSARECRQVAWAVAESPLVKTAFFASDPNWGRILAAIGRAGLPDLDPEGVSIHLGACRVVVNGARDPDYQEESGQAAMAGRDLTVAIGLGRGGHRETVWTSDLSHDYVRINASYRS